MRESTGASVLARHHLDPSSIARAYGVDVCAGALPPSSNDHRTLRWSLVADLSVGTFDDRRSGDDWRIENDQDRLYVSITDGAAFAFQPDHVPAVQVRLDGWSEDRALVFFLMGVLPLTLPRFGLAPLHGAAFTRADGSACVVMGDSGSGKTTTLGRHLALGAALVGDDACAFDEQGRIWPGPPMWASRDAPQSDLPDYLGKAVLPTSEVPEGPVSLGCSVILDVAAGATLGLERLTGRDALLGVVRHNRSSWLFTRPADQRRRLAVNVATASAPVAMVRYDPAIHGIHDVARVMDPWIDDPS